MTDTFSDINYDVSVTGNEMTLQAPTFITGKCPLANQWFWGISEEPTGSIDLEATGISINKRTGELHIACVSGCAV